MTAIITLPRPLRAGQIEAKLTPLAQRANSLMGEISQAKSWSDSILTDDHHGAGLILGDDGEPLSQELLTLYRQAFTALDNLRLAANATPQGGGPSAGALLRPYIP